MTRKLPLVALALLAGCSTPGLVVNSGPEPVVITQDSPPPEPQARKDTTTPVASPAAQPEAPKTPKPANRAAGTFQIVVASADTATIAARWVRKSEAAGYSTEVQAVDVKGKTWHRVLLTGYATLADATAALPGVKEKLGAPGAWVMRKR